MKTLHIVPVCDAANGMCAVASLLACEQQDASVLAARDFLRLPRAAWRETTAEVWVHGLWLPRLWRASARALRAGVPLVRMTHGALSPIYLAEQSPVRKRLARPVERFLFARCARVVATGAWEADWFARWWGAAPGAPAVVTTDVRRFFALEAPARPPHRPLRLLYLGRRHPLKGVSELEEAVRGLDGVELRVVGDAFGAEKETVLDWCDTLVLPTRSENFGLVVAEALAHGRRALVTDGAPAWAEGADYGGRLMRIAGYRDAARATRVSLLREALART